MTVNVWVYNKGNRILQGLKSAGNTGTLFLGRQAITGKTDKSRKTLRDIQKGLMCNEPNERVREYKVDFKKILNAKFDFKSIFIHFGKSSHKNS